MFDLSRSIEASRHSPVRVVFAALAGSALIAVSAKAHVPFWPVPMTLQVLAIMGLAVAFGPSIGLGMVAAYLVEGTLGLPVFSGTPERGIGIAYMLGPTGGYLLGMPIAAWAVGRLADGRSAFGQFAAMLTSVWRSSTSPACCGSRGLFRGPASSPRGSRRSFSAISSRSRWSRRAPRRLGASRLNGVKRRRAAP